MGWHVTKSPLSSQWHPPGSLRASAGLRGPHRLPKTSESPGKRAQQKSFVPHCGRGGPPGGPACLRAPEPASRAAASAITRGPTLRPHSHHHLDTLLTRSLHFPFAWGRAGQTAGHSRLLQQVTAGLLHESNGSAQRVDTCPRSTTSGLFSAPQLALGALAHLAHSSTYFWGRELLGPLASKGARAYSSRSRRAGQTDSVRGRDRRTAL